MLIKRIIGGLSLAMFMLLPQLGYATKLTFSTAALEVSAQREVLVDVALDPQEKKINVVEGVIQFSGPATDGLGVSIENGQSVLPIWPTPPQYNEATKSITFVGGVPQGFNSRGLLFRLRFTPVASGAMTIVHTSGSAYLNDGKGTKDFLESEALTLAVGEGELTTSETSSPSSRSVLNGIILALLAGIVCAACIYGYKKTHAR